jgi:hypothetical protein
MKYQKVLLGWMALSAISQISVGLVPVNAQAVPAPSTVDSPPAAPEADPSAPDLLTPNLPTAAPEAPRLPPEIIQQSPVFQRWQQEIPDVSQDIRSEPSFVTRVYGGYSVFPSSGNSSGFIIGVEDWFIGQSPVTLSADYQQNLGAEGNRRQAYGADLHYYVLPLGSYFNVSPIVGYRHADSAGEYSISGANLGVRLRFVPSRTGAADLTLDQSWIVGDSEGLSITQLNVGYAITPQLRLSTDLEWQSTADEGDSRVGVNLEWVP